MKRIILTLIIVSIITGIINADDVFYPMKEGGLFLSAELIYSFENQIVKSNSYLLWGGIGSVWLLPDLTDNPAFGGELAVELRHYFNRTTFSRFNISIYTGTAFMRGPRYYSGVKYESYWGFVNGIKTTYKVLIRNKIIIEPYVSLSYPIFLNITDSEVVNPALPHMTFGVRLGIGKLRLRN
jgi:hypothetical protein